MEESDFVLDTCILEYASSLTENPRDPKIAKARDFVRAFVACEDLYLSIDHKGKCQGEYDKIMDNDKYGQQVLRMLGSVGRIKKRKIKSLKTEYRGAFNELNDAHFDPDDYKFVQTTVASKKRRLVSEDGAGYTRRVQDILKKRLDIVVYNSSEAITLLPSEATSDRPCHTET